MSGFDAKRFAKHLRAAREEMGITQKELSDRTRIAERPDLPTVSTPYVSVLERGVQEGRPSDAYLQALAWALKRDVHEVREWAGIEPAPDWSTTLKAIAEDRNLTDYDKDLIKDIYLRLVPERR